MFVLCNASFQVDGEQILHPTTLEFQVGRITTLLGHNGSGKSTLLKLLSREYEPSNGEVSMDLQNIRHLSNKEFAKFVAYLPQQPIIPEGVTVRELVLFGRYPWKGMFGRYKTEDFELVDRSIEQVGLSHMSGHFVSTLSGGERQRAWVAMLLAQQSQCILLDEPTSALDIAHQYELLQLIKDLNSESGLTVIMVLHDINMASKFSDHLIALHSGKVIAQGKPKALMNPTTLEHIYGIKLSMFNHPNADIPVSYVP
ncbi:ATP-binding cassette domain-containing protein [Vibrio sp. S4M6]|uniref:ABC transporter ATP-binding protein n=1 Tax=Vibrio sinus TaxID=2946865 RepID=UPI002029BE4A|nr:ATP-binding cassette domain-containing protein [Vibrio sinus]MCL9780393.1 ATP-binding cassette domain-containing protein [Vibrio sinus]